MNWQRAALATEGVNHVDHGADVLSQLSLLGLYLDAHHGGRALPGLVGLDATMPFERVFHAHGGIRTHAG